MKNVETCNKNFQISDNSPLFFSVLIKDTRNFFRKSGQNFLTYPNNPRFLVGRINPQKKFNNQHFHQISQKIWCYVTLFFQFRGGFELSGPFHVQSAPGAYDTFGAPLPKGETFLRPFSITLLCVKNPVWRGKTQFLHLNSHSVPLNGGNIQTEFGQINLILKISSK